MDFLQDKIFTLPEFHKLISLIGKSKRVHLDEVQGSFRAFVALYLLKTLNRPVLYVASDLDSAEQMRDDLELIDGKERLAYLPATDFEPYDQAEPNPSLLSLQLDALQKFLEYDQWIAVSTAQSLVQRFTTPENFLDMQVYLHVGLHIDFEKLIGLLGSIGLKREDVVENVGEFSVRGGIIDIYAWNNEEPLRIEFFGNQIDSMRTFDVLSQRSSGKIEQVTILPNLSRGAKSVTLDQLIPEHTILFCEDTQNTRETALKYLEKAREEYELQAGHGVELSAPHIQYAEPAFVDKFLNSHVCIATSMIKEKGVPDLSFGSRTPPDFNGSIKLFLEYLKKRTGQLENPQIIVQSINQAQADRLLEIVEEENLEFNGKFMVGTLHGGFVIPALNLEVLTDHEIFKRFKRRQTFKRFRSGEYLRQLSTLNLYDYVVHIDYGIGQYLGMENVEYGNVKKECVKIGYRDGDSLFVTVDRLNRVQKYSSEEGVAPRLTKLGSVEWERTKKKTKESLKQVAAELIRIYAGRKAQGGYQFAGDNHWQKELEASFIYEETDDQLKSIEEVKRDMERDAPMDRLLCGDVGFGKTEVALRAAFKAIMDGKQVALLVPTTILAFQHYETFKDRLSEFPVEIGMLTRFRSKKEQEKIIKGLAEGNVDLVIGTHRLLSEDIKFKDLGLLIVDEEQRFGVRQKERLKKFRLSVDILSMTATPIPRTLHMALMGARDLSNIDTPPSNRLPVHTEIINWDDQTLFNIISKEISRGGQVYFVHNRVETIEAMKQTLAGIIPHARIAVGHGQLPERQLERVMLDFMNKKYDVLLATMIIENGLDIPNVNTIIINRADKFGLAQLYQLRGRVGRSKQQAYAYLLVPPMEKLTEIARKRLRAIQDFTDLGSGYKVALRDLEIRGAGNLLGKEQSGFVQSVGFELYCKILDEAVNELKKGLDEGQREPELIDMSRKYTDPKLDVDFDLLIPESYIPSELERISIYHRLVNFTNIDQIENLQEELADRFGKLPEEVEHFLRTIEIKVLASSLYAQRVIFAQGKVKLVFSEEAQNNDFFFKEIIPRLMNQKQAPVKFLNQKNLGVEVRLAAPKRLDQLLSAKKILRTVVGNN